MVEYLTIKGLFKDLPIELKQHAEAMRTPAYKNRLCDVDNLKLVEVIREVQK